MKPSHDRLFTRLLSAFLLGAISCYLICREPEPAVDNSKAMVGENSSKLTKPAPSSGDHTSLQPVADPGPGTKGFEPWANIEPIEVAVNNKGELNCDGSMCKTSVAEQQIIAGDTKRNEEVTNKGPTLAFPSVLPRPSRGHSIEVGVEYLSADNQK